MLKRIIILAVVLLVAALPAWMAQANANQIPVNVMVLSGTTGLSLVKMLHENPMLGRNLAVAYTVVRTPDQMVAKIISGEADIAAVPANTGAMLYNRGVGIQLAAVTNWGVTYLIGRDASIKHWADLKGKEVAVTGRGATPDILFRYFLDLNGLKSENDVRIQYYPTPVELAQLMMAGRVQTAVLPEPWVTEVMQKDPDVKILLDFQEEWKTAEKRRESYPQSALVVQAKFARDNPAVMAEFLKQAAASSAWVNRNPAEAGKLAQEYVGISADAARSAIPRCNLRFGTAGTVRSEVEYFLQKLLQFDAASVGGKLPDANFYLQ